MKNRIWKGWRWLGFLLGLFLLYVLGMILYGTLTDWQPEEKLPLTENRHTQKVALQDSIFSVLSWNIGYAGLGAESDFFFDKGNMWISRGAMARPERSMSVSNLEAIRRFLNAMGADFFLLQEVDQESRRSYYLDQADSLSLDKPDLYAGFAPNYRVNFVPTPVLEPWKAYGQVHSGLLTLSRVEPASSARLQLPGEYGWPTRVFQLDRCLAVHRIPIAGREAELVLINAHLSAYDAGGKLKKQQMDYIRALAVEEYERGNYVLIGGDWNQCPPFFRCDGFLPDHPSAERMIGVDPDLFPADWVWAYDPTLPTNRHVDAPYRPGETFVTLIDYFLLSPNLQLKQVKTLDQGFRNSDHQPVWVEVELIP
jgi:endonuclease/exonuclease/phosphatase family metal-dependent hydrolase